MKAIVGRYAPGLVLTLALISCTTFGGVVAKKGTEASLSTNGASPIAGTWSGSILVGAQTIPVIMHFSGSQGDMSGTVDIPSQHARGLALDTVSAASGSVSFTLNVGSDVAHFDGTFDGTTINGTFRQGPATGTFSLSRQAADAGSAPPAEHHGTEISLQTPTGTIFGSLELPATSGPYPVALIIAGSGPTDRDGNSPLLPGKNNALEMLADALEAAGIASVRYDKRGVGESAAASQSESSLRFSTYVDDAAAWITQLKRDDRFTRVAVIGHSEGSLIGMVAVNTVGADAFVSLDGAGRAAGDLLKEQLAAQPDTIKQEAYAIIDSLEAGKLVQDVPQPLQAIFRPSVQPYVMSWFQYDPQAEIARINAPILIVQGTTDLQVPVSDAQLLKKAQPRATLDIIDGMNHVLKPAPADRRQNLDTYGDPNLRLAPKLVSSIDDFLTSVLRR